MIELTRVILYWTKSYFFLDDRVMRNDHVPPLKDASRLGYMWQGSYRLTGLAVLTIECRGAKNLSCSMSE
jgi:hypothetical protein